MRPRTLLRIAPSVRGQGWNRQPSHARTEANSTDWPHGTAPDPRREWSVFPLSQRPITLREPRWLASTWTLTPPPFAPHSASASIQTTIARNRVSVNADPTCSALLWAISHRPGEPSHFWTSADAGKPPAALTCRARRSRVVAQRMIQAYAGPQAEASSTPPSRASGWCFSMVSASSTPRRRGACRRWTAAVCASSRSRARFGVSPGSTRNRPLWRSTWLIATAAGTPEPPSCARCGVATAARSAHATGLSSRRLVARRAVVRLGGTTALSHRRAPDAHGLQQGCVRRTVGGAPRRPPR